MTIAFNAIPIDLRTPGQYIEIDASRATGGLPAAPARLLVIGQRLATGSVAALVPTRLTSADAAAAAFGRGSMLHQMVAALRQADDLVEAWAVALDDLNAGVAATKTITFTGPAAAAGTLPMLVQGVRVPVGVAVGDTAAAVAAATAAAINATPNLIATAVANAAVVTLTLRHKGAAGNALDIRSGYYSDDVIPAGITVTIADGVAGTGNPDITAVFTVVGDTRYAGIIHPYTDAANMAALEAELTRRWGPLVRLDGVAYEAIDGGYSATATLGAARNSPFASIAGLRNPPQAPWQIAASYGAVINMHGSIDPARPFTDLPLPGILAPAVADRWTSQEVELLLHDGISPLVVDASGSVTIKRAITTYQVNRYGQSDIAFLDVTTPLTVAYLRYSAQLRVATKFPRMKAADDGTPLGVDQAIVTPGILGAEMLALGHDWLEAGLIEDIDAFRDNLVVERSTTDPNRFDAILAPNIVNGFLVFAASIQFRL